MKNSVYGLILRLVSYGINTGLIEKEDIIYTQNRLLSLFHMDEPDDSCTCLTADNEDTLEEILSGLLDYAYEKGIIPENTVTYRDLFDVKLMASLVKRPSEVIREFWQNYSCSPKLATDSYYKFSCDTDYIRRYRIKKDLKWKTSTEYGDIDITVNLSKPEKDPKAIAAAKLQKQSGYPKCLLCKENEGYAGRVNHPARDNHRIIPLTIDGDNWFMQYSPYVYYNEHCIVFNGEHTPMVINDSTFRKLFDFISQFPHYIIGSNADLPIVGGSILTHEHFQGGRYSFALNRAEVERKFIVNGFDDVECGIVKWPMSVVRLTGKNKDSIISLSSHILKSWRAYTDADVGIFAETDGEIHNTITPIAFTKDGKFVIDLVLRNNITSEEHPLGVFHPHANLHHIKKENIGLIEVMGLAVLPSRLKDEMAILKDAILNHKDVSEIPKISKHSEWVNEFVSQYDEINENNIDSIIQNEIGKVFLNVLLDAGVFKRTPEGQKAFDHIIGALKDFRLSHGGQRIGAGRKNAGTKAVLVRLTDEQHETLKKLGGSSWIQNAMNAQKDVSGKSIVIDFDFGGWQAMTSEEVDNLEKDWGETAWNESGPYVCTSPKDAIALIADQIECETQSNLPNIDKIDRLNDLLKEFVKLI